MNFFIQNCIFWALCSNFFLVSAMDYGATEKEDYSRSACGSFSYLKTVSLGKGLYSAAYNFCRQMIITGSFQGSIEGWDIITGEQLWQFKDNLGAIFSIACNPEGNIIAFSSSDKSVHIFDIDRKRRIGQLLGHEEDILVVSFSPDGKTIFTGGENAEAYLWDAIGGHKIISFHGHEGSINAVAFNADGTEILTGSSDSLVRLWSAITGEFIREFKGHEETVISVSFVPHQTAIITGSIDGSACVWDIKTGAKLHHFVNESRSLTSLSCSCNGSFAVIITGKEKAFFWNLENGSIMREVVFPYSSSGSAEVYLSVFTPGDKALIIASSLNSLDGDTSSDPVFLSRSGGQRDSYDQYSRVKVIDTFEDTPFNSGVVTEGLRGGVHIWTSSVATHAFFLGADRVVDNRFKSRRYEEVQKERPFTVHSLLHLWETSRY